jgi:hypothetical protein
MTHIEKLEADRDERLRALDAQIKVLKERPKADANRERLIEEAEARRDTIATMYTNAIADAKIRADAEAIAEKIRTNRLTDAQEREAAKQAERFKYAAWKEYFAAGGTKAEFEEAWPELRKKLIEERIKNPAPARKTKPATL